MSECGEIVGPVLRELEVSERKVDRLEQRLAEEARVRAWLERRVTELEGQLAEVERMVPRVKVVRVESRESRSWAEHRATVRRMVARAVAARDGQLPRDGQGRFVRRGVYLGATNSLDQSGEVPS